MKRSSLIGRPFSSWIMQSVNGARFCQVRILQHCARTAPTLHSASNGRLMCCESSSWLVSVHACYTVHLTMAHCHTLLLCRSCSEQADSHFCRPTYPARLRGSHGRGWSFQFRRTVKQQQGCVSYTAHCGLRCFHQSCHQQCMALQLSPT